ncbi:MAG: hypothetical protein LUQ25_00605 [Methanoregulaceae archaeon]|nr:hypothetical protein [Methanoregulaceae archaeon]
MVLIPQGDEIDLVLATSATLKNHTTDTIRELTTSGYSVVVVSVTLPYIVLKKIYETGGVDLSRLHIIDAVTKYSGGKVPETDGLCTFISNPGNLTDIGIAANEWFRSLPEGRRCLVLDDISTMLLYSPSVSILKFIHFITNKLRILEIRGVLFAVEKGLPPMVMAQLSTFSDHVITADAA